MIADLFLLSRLVNFLNDAYEDTEHKKNYHICAKIVSRSVTAGVCDLICLARLLAGLLLVLLLQFGESRELFFYLGHQFRKQLSGIRIRLKPRPSAIGHGSYLKISFFKLNSIEFMASFFFS